MNSGDVKEQREKYRKELDKERLETVYLIYGTKKNEVISTNEG